jgi:hypothetical protein
MQNCCFPDELKTGRISPIYKKDNDELLENYRPVSTLPVFGPPNLDMSLLKDTIASGIPALPPPYGLLMAP